MLVHGQELVQALALAKADALLQRPEVSALKREDGTFLLVTSDQVVVHAGEIREKPEDKDQARRFIRSAVFLPRVLPAWSTALSSVIGGGR